MKVRPCLIVQLPDNNLQREEVGGVTVQHKPETVQVDKTAISVRTISSGRGPGENGNSSRRYAFPSAQSAGGGREWGNRDKTRAEVNKGEDGGAVPGSVPPYGLSEIITGVSNRKQWA